MKIAICGLVESENLGEKFVADSLSCIIKNTLQNRFGEQVDPEFIYVDLLGRNDNIVLTINPDMKRKEIFAYYKNSHYLGEAFYVFLRNLVRKSKSFKLKNVINKFRHRIWEHSYNLKSRYLMYYDSKFKDADIIVIDGAGLLEYSYNEYQEQLALISEYAQQHGLNVVYNAIGRAGEFDPNDFRAKILMKALSADVVKYVSARDSAEAVQECVGQGKKVKLLADAAFCLDEAYGIKKNETSNLIGIGLIRGTALQSYDQNFAKDDWIRLFSDIALELKKRGQPFRFFTNGFHEDYEIGLKVLECVGLEKSFLVQRPVDSRELLQTIASYKGIITCRMHSSIAAFSLGIPSVILNWNNKVKLYMEQIGYPERTVDLKDFNAGYIVDRLEDAVEKGIDDSDRLRMKVLAKQSVEDYADLLSVYTSDQI